MQRQELVSFLDDYLQASIGRDYCPNGLQVQGRDDIRRIVTGVSACVELFEEARRREADAILVHHGIFWDKQPVTLVGPRHRRVAILMASEINLLAYHLPLDRHPELGNNMLAARSLGLEAIEPFGTFDGLPIGFQGNFSRDVSIDNLTRQCRDLYGQDPLVFAEGPDAIRTLGIISGGAQSELHTAIDAGLDAFITGEVSEWVLHTAREAGIHYLACGHHATERLGIRALGEYLASRFDLEAEFVDIPNPV